MSVRNACGVVFAAALMTLGTVPGREHPVVGALGTPIERLEARLAAEPSDLASRTELARAYLDAESPGLAWSTLASAPAAQQNRPELEHMAARVLIAQGKAKDALALEERVLATCDADPVEPARCNVSLVASATRRADILQELVKQGVEDAVAQPEASLVAYHRATREARVTVVE